MTEGVSATGGKVLLITAKVDPLARGGREQLSKLNEQALQEILGDDLLVMKLPKRNLRGREAIKGVIRGHIDGVCDPVVKHILSVVQSSEIECIVLDGSNLGAVARSVRRYAKDVKVLTFFHNCEARFFLGAFRQEPSLHSFGVLVANYLAERWAVRFSHKRVCLNQRDGDLLERLYGRSATHLAPMALRDKRPLSDACASWSVPAKYALFVGGAFYANRAGIGWYCAQVAAHVGMKTVVVGQGLDSARSELEQYGNVEVIGEVEELAPWYQGAHVVVAPIFDGSGMKTKVAEALMFGKRIIGTPEAFSGYEEHIGAVGVVCRTAEEFVEALEAEAKREAVNPSASLRAIYEDHYSLEAAERRWAAILNDQRESPGSAGP